MNNKNHLFSKGLLFCAITLFSLFSLQAQTSIAGKEIIGVWKTIDDETGKEKSHVKISESGGKYQAQIIKLLDPETLKTSKTGDGTDLLCDECPEEFGKGEKLIGLKMVWGMEKLSDKLGGGTILDPNNGKTYKCTMWLDDDDPKGNTLNVRGWLAFFYRTQTWYRVE